jgi:ABC-type hemin transport system ATPase subunit
VPFLFGRGESMPALLDRVRRTGGWGEIVGPHGSGKSTLLASLAAALATTGTATRLIRLSAGQRRPPRRALDFAGLAPGSIVAVDGYEQLGRWWRFQVRRVCRRGRLGLIVTAHGSAGLPRLATLQPDLATVERLVDELTKGRATAIRREDVARCFANCGGDVRETLFALYDLHERRR